MSGSLGELTVRFTGDASQLAATISEVQGQLSGLQKKSGGATAATEGFIKNTKRGSDILSQYKAQMTAAGKAVDEHKTALAKAKTAVETNNSALTAAQQKYEATKKSVFDNCAALKQQEKAIRGNITSRNNELKSLNENSNYLKGQKKAISDNIKELQKRIKADEEGSVKLKEHKEALTADKEALASVKRMYDDNQKAVKFTSNELSNLKQQELNVQNALNSQGQALRSSIVDYNNAGAAVRNANKGYEQAETALKSAQNTYREYQDGLAAVEKQQRALNLQTAGKSMQEAGKNIDTVTKPLQAAAVALAAGGVASAKFAIDFEDNFANVKKTVEGTPEQLTAVKQGIIDLSTKGIDGRNALPQTTAQLTELAAAGGQLGIQTENIIEFTETMAQMGTATNLAGAEGAATLARFMNVTNTSQDQVKNLGSAIVDLGNNFATTESEIATLALRMGATGNVVGISAQDVLGYSTALSSMGIEAEAGGSAVSRIWMDIQSAVSSGGEELATFAKVSGKSSEEFAQQWKTDASGAFQTFLTGLSKSEDQIATLGELGFNNIRDIQALQRLASEKGIQLVTDALRRANSAWEENIALQKEADAKAETTAGQIQITKNNLVEAGRSIGEAFLPMIADASAGIADFAQKLADMDEGTKRGLVKVAAGVTALGAGAKVVSGTAKGIGSFVEAIGKIRSALPATEAAIEGLETMSTVGSTFTSTVAPALATSLGWLAVPAAMYAGMELWAAHLEKVEEEYLNIGDGAKEIAKTTAAAIVAASSVDDYAKKLKEANDIIAKGNDGTPEGGAAYNTALEQRKQYIQWFIDNYGEYVSALESGNDVSESTVQTIQKMTRAEKSAKMSELDAKVSEGGYSISGLKDSISDYQKQNEAIYDNNAALYQLKAAMTSLNTEYSALDNSLANGEITKGEYADGIDALTDKYKNWTDAYRDLTGDDFNWANADMAADALAAIDQRLSENGDAVEDNKRKIGEAQESINEYQEAARIASDVMIDDLPNAMAKGGSAAQEYISKIGEYGKKTGLDFNEMGNYANQAALKLNGFNSAADMVAAGNDAVNATVNDCVNTMQQWGYSAEQAAVQGSLLKNGFDDLASAAATDGGLEAVSQQATELAQAMGTLPENKSISINADGDISIIDEVEEKTDEIDGKETNTTTNVTEGDTSGMDAAEEAESKDGESSNIDVNVTEGDTSGIEAAEEAESKDGNGIEVPVNYKPGELPTPDELAAEGTVNYTMGDHPTTVPPVNGDVNFTMGDHPTTVPPANGDANFTLGEHPTTVPAANGKANFAMGEHPTAAPTIYGKAVYTITYHGGLPLPGKAKGTSDFEGGFAMINDQRGVRDPRELVQIGNKGYIFEGKDVVLPLPRHAKVFTAAQTKNMMAAAGIPHYASGKNNEAWENAKSDREHIRATTYGIIPAWEELKWLEDMKKEFASDAEVIKEIEEEVVKYTREMWQENLDSMQYALDMGWTSEEEYYSNLAAYRDENFAPDTQEYKDATLELHKYSVQLIKDANEASRAYIDLHGSLNDWGEMGTSMGAVWQTVNQRNVQAAKDGLITWDEYFENREELTEQFLDNYSDYSDDWIKHEQDYNNLSAEGTIEAINRQRTEVENYFAEIGELTDEEYLLKIKIEAELDDKALDAAWDAVEEWRSDADWYKKQADVYGWDFLHPDSETEYWQRVIKNYTDAANSGALSKTDRDKALREADEARLELYKATEDTYDDMLDATKDRMDELKEALDDRLEALETSWEVEDRAEDKSETIADINKFRNAVTLEGREKYQEALDKLKEIERDEMRFELEQENNAIMEQMQAEYDALEEKKADALEQLKAANMRVASLVQPLDSSINSMETSLNNKMDALINVLQTQIEKLKPDVTVNQEINSVITDGTDGQILANSVFNKILAGIGG